MTKVEELRGLLRQYLLDIEDTQHRDMTDEAIDSLIAAAREEGRAEGAEQERLKVLSEATFLRHDFDARETEHFYGEREDNGDVEVLARKDCYIIPASLLAPASGSVEPQKATPEQEAQYRLAMGRAMLGLAPAPKEPTNDEKIARLAEIVTPAEAEEIAVITRGGPWPPKEEGK
jgi:hypothetical protein